MFAPRGVRLRMLLVALLFVLLFAVGRITGVVDHLSPEGVRTWIREAGVWGFVLFIGAFAIGELIHVPGMVFVVGAVLAFGKTGGCAISLFAALVSVSATFSIVRMIGGRALASVDRPFMKKMLVRL